MGNAPSAPVIPRLMSLCQVGRLGVMATATPPPIEDFAAFHNPQLARRIATIWVFYINIYGLREAPYEYLIQNRANIRSGTLQFDRLLCALLCFSYAMENTGRPIPRTLIATYTSLGLRSDVQAVRFNRMLTYLLDRHPFPPWQETLLRPRRIRELNLSSALYTFNCRMNRGGVWHQHWIDPAARPANGEVVRIQDDQCRGVYFPHLFLINSLLRGYQVRFHSLHPALQFITDVQQQNFDEHLTYYEEEA